MLCYVSKSLGGGKEASYCCVAFCCSLEAAAFSFIIDRANGIIQFIQHSIIGSSRSQ